MSRARFLAGCLLLAACTADPVTWDAERRSDTPPAPGSRLLLDGSTGTRFAPAWVPPALPAGTPRCDGSLMATPARGDTAYAVWWAPRPDSSALLVVARSVDRGHTWRTPEVADSTEKGHPGCGRPAPFILADTTNGYVHVVYFMVASEGAGIFFTHSMGGGEMFHSPVAIVYGDRPSAAAVAADGDTVAVAYLDPNAATPQLWLALSRVTGHYFDSRMAVSSPMVQASRPAVAVRGHRIAVAWIETGREGATGGEAAMISRTGRWR